jgi:DNA-binding transcriptional MerR regulator
MTVDQLAERSGVPVRTVRYYQTEGLLPLPERIGREARYTVRHLNHLLAIGEFRRRGFGLTAIAELMKGGFASPEGWLGLEASLTRPWTEDRPVLLTEPELRERLGDKAGDLTIAVLQHSGLVERRADTTPVTFLVPSPALLEIGLALTDLGIDVSTSAAMRQLLQSQLGRLAEELVTTMTERVSLDRLATGGPDEVATLIEQLRPLARRSVEVVFAHEMERALRAFIDQRAFIEEKEGTSNGSS